MNKIKLRGKTVSGGKYGERQKLYDWAYRDRSYASALYDEAVPSAALGGFRGDG